MEFRLARLCAYIYGPSRPLLNPESGRMAGFHPSRNIRRKYPLPSCIYIYILVFFICLAFSFFFLSFIGGFLFFLFSKKDVGCSNIEIEMEFKGIREDVHSLDS